MTLNLNTKVIEFLKLNPEKKFKAREIGKWIIETYPDECRQKQERSTAVRNPLDNEMVTYTRNFDNNLSRKSVILAQTTLNLSSTNTPQFCKRLWHEMKRRANRPFTIT